MTTGEHISHKFDEDVEEVTTSVLNMGGLVVQQIEKSVKALLAGDKEMAEEVIEDDLKVNTFDVDIDEMCNSIRINLLIL